MQPLVSVILPVFNAGPGLQAAFRQLGDLDYSNIEIIIIDDGSTDDTVEHVRDFASNDQRVVVITSKHNRGAGPSRNDGLRSARGKYVWFVDWDDEWSGAIVRRLVDEAELHGATIVACRGIWQNEAGQRLGYTDGVSSRALLDGPSGFDLLLRGELKGYLWNKLFRRTSLGVDPFPAIRTHEDLWVVVEVLRQAAVLAVIPDLLYIHQIRPGSLSNSRDPELDNLTRSREHIREVAGSLPFEANRERLLAYYDVAGWILPRVTTAIRLGSRELAEAEIVSARTNVRCRHILQLVGVSVPTALEMLMLKMLGRHFILFRSIGLDVRHACRQRLRRGTPEKGGRSVQPLDWQIAYGERGRCE